ncbi:SDR family NAD(P)-dependent oxidoreductase [Azospirillum sp. ST 5-10]|uniref:SDR family NAD(P)-dependent oxidoreductase n=1 Tax=unclassified Azospirillum TaxID=2630922 RepID=UPI003F4A0A66
MTDLNARAVLVTGGSRGIGLAIVERLLAEGYRVATCSRSRSPALDRLEAAHGAARLHRIACAIGDPAQEEALFAGLAEWLDGQDLYGLVNNTGIAGEGVLATFPTVDAEQLLQVNLLGALRVTRLALRRMLRQPPGGRIVSISSIVAQRGYTGLAAYAASKAGLDGMTRALAREVGRRGITVNAVAPGYVATELSASLGERQRAQIVNRTPLGRLAEPAEVAAVVAFLVGEDARFITGQTLVVDGGITC